MKSVLTVGGALRAGCDGRRYHPPPLEDLLKAATTATDCETNLTTRGAGLFHPTWESVDLTTLRELYTLK
jgi:hypothetical protein